MLVRSLIGVFDALQLTGVRSYRSKPTNQYRRIGCNDAGNDEDEIGYLTRTRYDWRSRPVIVERHPEGAGTGTPLSQTVTFLDHADRVRLTVEYGGQRPTGDFDPVARSESLDVPTAAEILAAEPPPLRLTESLYSTRGEPLETREYDVSDETAATFTFTRTVTDYAGRAAIVHQTNGATTRNTYDGAGRLTRSSVYAGNTELARTESDYDTMGNVTTVRASERVIDGTGDLTSVNSVTSYTHTWYDSSKRPIATLEYGSASLNDKYEHSSAPVRAAQPPARASIPSHARLTERKYDRYGREWQTIYANGAVTEREFDGFGRETLVRELDAPNGSVLRRTAYRYDDQGRLSHIAAVRPNHPAVINWALHNGSLQTTELVYTMSEASPSAPPGDGAFVVDASGTPISRNASWVAAIRFPDAPCPCDFVPGGGVDPTDLFGFLDAWFIENGQSGAGLLADFDGSGTVDSDDLFGFLDCFYAPPQPCQSTWDNSAGDLVFTYLPDGRVYSRTLLDGSSFTYVYDALDRLNRINATPSFASNLAAVVDALSSVEYQHDAVGRLTRATAWTTGDSAQPRLVADSLFTYDGFGRLTSERPSLGAAATLNTPPIVYAWETASTTATNPFERRNTSRVASMSYQQHPQPPPGAEPLPPSRTVQLGYGTANSATDLLARVASLSDARLPAVSAAWSYSGTGQRLSESVGLHLGMTPALSMSAGASVQASAASVERWNSHRQRAELHYLAAELNVPFYRSLHAFDRSGNRLRDRLELAVDNDTATPSRSWGYAYDALNRLASAQRGVWNTSSAQIDLALDPAAAFSMSWGLDDLGNWTGNAAASPAVAGLRREWGFDAFGDPRFTQGASHVVNERNELAKLTSSTSDNAPTGGGDPDVVGGEQTLIYDAAGRLVYDSSAGLLFRYDSWSRLVQVRSAPGLSVNADGSIVSGSSVPPGRLVAHYVYDALGRLVSRQTPHTGPPSLAQTPDEYDLRQEVYAYDGVRRVRSFAGLLERPSSPPAGTTWPDDRWPGEMGVALEPTARRTTLGLDAQAELPGVLLEREHVWGPTPDAAVDELLAEIAWTWSPGTGGGGGGGGGGGTPLVPSETVLYAVRNASNSVVGFVDQTGTPAAIFEYTPYGELTLAQAWSSGGGGGVPGASALALQSRVGHQGLFFDNLETPWGAEQKALAALNGGGGSGGFGGLASALSGPGTPSGLRSPIGLYHNRNRTYLPSLGRFAQRDPNASGQVVALADWWGGSEPLAWPPVQDAKFMYEDGLGLHAYLRGNPVGHGDPAGLFIGGMVGMIGGAPASMDPYLDYNDEVMDHGQSMLDFIGSSLQSVAFDQYLDYFWASDWSQPDDLYRGSAAWSMGTGSWEGAEATGTFRTSPMMASGWADTIRAGMTSNATGMGVYLILDEAGDVIYAGRSVNLGKRMEQSLLKHGGAHAIGIAVDGRSTMRSMEDLMIRYYDLINKGNNKINGVAVSNANRKEYYKALKTFMSKLK